MLERCSEELDPLTYIHRARMAIRAAVARDTITLPSLETLDPTMRTTSEDVLCDTYTRRLAWLLGLIDSLDMPAQFFDSIGEMLQQTGDGERLSRLQSTILIFDVANRTFCTLIRENAKGVLPMRMRT